MEKRIRQAVSGVGLRDFTPIRENLMAKNMGHELDTANSFVDPHYLAA